MPSSIKMIKANNVYGGETSARIDTQYEIEEPETITSPESEDLSSKLNQAEKKRKEILEKSSLESQQILEEAKQEAEKIKETAQKEGYEAGYEKGLEEGHQQGLTEGLEQAEVENQQLQASILTMIEETQNELQKYKKDQKENFLKLASFMAEKIIHEHIDKASDGVLSLAQPYLYQLEKDEEFVTITVHPQQKKILEEHKAQIEAISPNTRFMIFSHPKIEEKGIIIESSKAVIDLQVKKQIDTMLKEFEEMERTVDA